MKGYDSQNSINRIAIGILIVLIALFCCLSLFGALAGVGEMVYSFLLGAFGYASYAYFIGLILIGFAVIFNLKVTLEPKKIVGLCLLLATGIWALHIYLSNPYIYKSTSPLVFNNYGEYLSVCYYSHNTVGGGLFGVISYPFQRYFTPLGAIIFVCVLFFVMLFMAIFPFIKGSKSITKSGIIKKGVKGEKITAQKSPTLTVFSDNGPTTFIPLSQSLEEEEGKEGYNPISPNEIVHSVDEEKTDGRGAKFALGEEMIRRDKPHDISRGTYKPNDSGQNSNGQLLRDILFDKTLDDEKYREYVQSREQQKENTVDETNARLDNAYHNTMSKNLYNYNREDDSSKIKDIFMNVERRRNAQIAGSPFPNKTPCDDNTIDFSKKAEYAKKNIPELKDPSEWDEPIESESIDFTALKEEQRNIYKSKSMAKPKAKKAEKLSKNGGPSIWDIDANDTTQAEAGNIFGVAKKTWGSESENASENLYGTHIEQNQFQNKNAFQGVGNFDNNQNFIKSNNMQNGMISNQDNTNMQNAGNGNFSQMPANNFNSQNNNMQGMGNGNFSQVPNMNNFAGQNGMQNGMINGGQNPYNNGMVNNYSNMGMPYNYLQMPMNGYMQNGYMPQQNGINYVWTPNGYVPQGGMQNPMMYPQGVNNMSNSYMPQSETFNSAVRPLESNNFRRDPETGVYSNFTHREEERFKTYEPNFERGRQLNEEAEKRKFSDIKRARLERIAELKRKQAERKFAKELQQENKDNEYNEAVARGREIASELLKDVRKETYKSSFCENQNVDYQSNNNGYQNGNGYQPQAQNEYSQNNGYQPQDDNVNGYHSVADGRALTVQDNGIEYANHALPVDGVKPVVRSGLGTFFGKAGDLKFGKKNEEENNNDVPLNDVSAMNNIEDAEYEKLEEEKAKYLDKHNRKKNKNIEPKVRTAQITIEESIEKTEPRKPYVPPTLDLLEPPEINQGPSEDIEEKKKTLIETLEYFNVKAEVLEVVCGPAFSLFRLTINEMPRGKTITWLQTLENDLAMKMAEISVKILAPIPGQNAVGVEVSNKKRRMVRISSILQSDEFKHAKNAISFALGENIYGKNYVCDIKSLPHLLIAGQTGAGKSCCINTLIVSLLYHAGPEDVRFIMIDPKRMELSQYKGIPHLLLDDIIYDADKAIKALQWCIDEMQRRIDFFNKNGYRDIEEYNTCKLQDDFIPMPRIIIIVDELAELMDRGSKIVENCIDRLARLARAVGIHLICATQRPSVDIISGTIKNNLPSRIAFRVPTVNDSRTVLGVGGAENLLGDGDLLYMNPRLTDSQRVQGAFISGAEVKVVVEFIKNHNTATYDEKIKDAIFKEEENEEPKADAKKDTLSPKVLEAIKVGLDGSLISISMLQRKLGVGYPRAGAIFDQLESMGILGEPQKPTNGRPITMSREEYEQLLAESESEE